MSTAPLKTASFQNFAAFKDISLDFSSGINIFIGDNGTGKTHILKCLYAACDYKRADRGFTDKLVRVFRPSGGIGRLVWRAGGPGVRTATVTLTANNSRALKASFTTRDIDPPEVNDQSWFSERVECAYIPVKEMLANAPKFRTLYDDKEVHFEEVYYDIINCANRAVPRGPRGEWRQILLDQISKVIDGTVTTEGETFYLKNEQGNLEFTLLAEGHRKLALLLLLIQNSTLQKDSILFWDEPETNLNPRLMDSVVNLLLTLQRNGVQIFCATHSYEFLNWLHLKREDSDQVLFHALYRDRDTNEIRSNATTDFLQIEPNAISDTFSDMFDVMMDRAVKGTKS